MTATAHVSAAAPARGPKLDNRRVLAGVVDLVIVAAGAAVVLFAGDALTGDLGEIQGALGMVVLAWALYYFFALESGDGQTVGKKLMKLRVVCLDGSPAGMREVAVRTILRVVDNYLVGLIVMLATGDRRQRIGDLAAGTIIVDASGPAQAVPALAEEPVESDREPAAAETATITLPARSTPPATLADLAAPEAPEAPAVPELRPFPPVEEPAAEEPVVEEPVAEEPVMVEPVAEAPVEYAEPAVQAEPAEDVEPVAEDVAHEELPEITSPSIEELAQDVADAQVEPVEAEAQSVDVEAEPVAVEVDDAPADEGPVNVKSVETVSAIDLIMGGAAENDAADDEGSAQSSQDPGDSASH